MKHLPYGCFCLLDRDVCMIVSNRLGAAFHRVSSHNSLQVQNHLCVLHSSP